MKPLIIALGVALTLSAQTGQSSTDRLIEQQRTMLKVVVYYDHRAFTVVTGEQNLHDVRIMVAATGTFQDDWETVVKLIPRRTRLKISALDFRSDDGARFSTNHAVSYAQVRATGDDGHPLRSQAIQIAIVR